MKPHGASLTSFTFDDGPKPPFPGWASRLCDRAEGRKVGTGQFYRAEECIEGELAAREALPESSGSLPSLKEGRRDRLQSVPAEEAFAPLLERVAWKIVVIILIALVVVQVLIVIQSALQLSVVGGWKVNH